MSLSIAFVGTGWFAAVHADLLARSDGARVAGFAGTSLEKAERMASRYAGAAGYDGVEQLLDRCRPDAVYISVPPFAHGPIEEKVIERGIPFFVEKPIGADLDTPRRVLELVSEKKLLTSVGYHFRYMDGTTIAREKLRHARIGMAQGYWLGDMPKVGWWRRQEGSGGQMIEQTTHIVDLLRYTAGEVTEVYAAYALRSMHEKEEGVTTPDVGTVTLKLACGAVASVSNTCLLPFGHRSELVILTDEGVLELSGKGLNDIRSGTTVWTANRTNPYETENEAFLHALRTGDASRIRCDYEDAFRTQRVTAAALASAEQGVPIRLD